jgi:hypothetical protein
VLVAPWRKNLTFTFGAPPRFWNDIRYAKRPQLPNLPRACILIGQPPADELEVLSAWRDPAACSAPAPPASSEMMMMSAGASGS